MYSDIAANKRKTVYIILVFLLFVSGMLWLLKEYLGGSIGVFYGGLIGALVYVIFTYYSGSKMALAVNGAKQISKNDNPRLWRIVENLSITNGMPMPKVYVIDDPALNAFATGRDPKHSAVCATTGILAVLDDTELEGVFAHELGHVKQQPVFTNRGHSCGHPGTTRSDFDTAGYFPPARISGRRYRCSDNALS
jgi:heat shock protein HtpX